MKKFITLLALIYTTTVAQALVINEVMSNPIGDDSGREWIELYNNEESVVDISTLTISIKGGTFIPVIQVSGGISISPHGYAIIGSTVSGATKFTLDYPSYSGPLLRSSISLVNTGVTSIEIKLQGTSADTLSSYTAAKEGNTYSLIGGIFTVGTPSPGEENKQVLVTTNDTTQTQTATEQTVTQTTITQAPPPSADIIFYLPKEKTVIAGAPSLFSTYTMSHDGKPIDAMLYTWSFGDGGERKGATTTYRYFYPGNYVVEVEGGNNLVAGTGVMKVRVVAPDISVSTVGIGKYGSYIDFTNPNNYDLDISHWKISIDGAVFPFPKNTILGTGITRFPGITMGFASSTITSETLIKLLFPNMEEVLRVTQGVSGSTFLEATTTKSTVSLVSVAVRPQGFEHQAKKYQVSASSTSSTSSGTNLITKTVKKDIRLASFIKSLFR